MVTINFPMFSQQTIDEILSPPECENTHYDLKRSQAITTFKPRTRIIETFNLSAPEIHKELKSVGIAVGVAVSDQQSIETIVIERMPLGSSRIIITYTDIPDIHERTSENFGVTWA